MDTYRRKRKSQQVRDESLRPRGRIGGGGTSEDSAWVRGTSAAAPGGGYCVPGTLLSRNHRRVVAPHDVDGGDKAAAQQGAPVCSLAQKKLRNREADCMPRPGGHVRA